MPVLKEWRLERVAQELAIGRTAEEASSVLDEDGKPLYPPGSSFASNARKRAYRADVQRRVAELRAPGIRRMEKRFRAEVEHAVELQKQAEERVTIGVEWVLMRLAELASFNPDDYLSPPDPVTGERRIDISRTPRAKLACLTDVGQDVADDGRGFRVSRTKIKGDPIAALREMARIMEPPKDETAASVDRLGERLDRAIARMRAPTPALPASRTWTSQEESPVVTPSDPIENARRRDAAGGFAPT